MSITRNDWLKAFREATKLPPQDPDVVSVRELGTLLGLGYSAASTKARIMVKAGCAEKTSKLIQDANGVIRRVSAYRLLGKKGKKGKGK